MAGRPFSVYGNIIQPQLSQRQAQVAAIDGVAALNAVDVLPPELQVTSAILQNLQPAGTGTPATDQRVLETSRYSNFNNQALNIGLASTLVLQRPAGRRVFLMIVNTHATQTLFVRFGANSDMIIGLPIQPAFGFFGLDTVVAQDDVYLVANGAGTTGVLLYSNI